MIFLSSFLCARLLSSSFSLMRPLARCSLSRSLSFEVRWSSFPWFVCLFFSAVWLFVAYLFVDGSSCSFAFLFALRRRAAKRVVCATTNHFASPCFLRVILVLVGLPHRVGGASGSFRVVVFLLPRCCVFPSRTVWSPFWGDQLWNIVSPHFPGISHLRHLVVVLTVLGTFCCGRTSSPVLSPPLSILR